MSLPVQSRLPHPKTLFCDDGTAWIPVPLPYTPPLADERPICPENRRILAPSYIVRHRINVQPPSPPLPGPNLDSQAVVWGGHI